MNFVVVGGSHSTSKLVVLGDTLVIVGNVNKSKRKIKLLSNVMEKAYYNMTLVHAVRSWLKNGLIYEHANFPLLYVKTFSYFFAIL